jgi:hypothetical protein
MEYVIFTLVDITNTNQYRSEFSNDPARLQQQNFDTVLQTIGLRGNVYYTVPPRSFMGRPKDYDIDYDGSAKIWEFQWNMEMEFLFHEAGDDVALLKRDFKYVPYIPNLAETAKFQPSVFLPGVNITFRFIK